MNTKSMVTAAMAFSATAAFAEPDRAVTVRDARIKDKGLPATSALAAGLAHIAAYPQFRLKLACQWYGILPACFVLFYYCGR